MSTQQAGTARAGAGGTTSNTNQAMVDSMVSEAIRGLTGEPTDADAWDALFRHFNQNRGLGDVGYESGEKIAIKINMNQEDSTSGNWSSSGGYPSPHVIYSVVKQLINVVGVPGSAITIYDASRYIGNPIYNKVRGDPNPDYRNVRFVVKSIRAANGRIGAVHDGIAPMYNRSSRGNAYPPSCVTEANYLINMALLRAHSLYGVTLCAKIILGRFVSLRTHPTTTGGRHRRWHDLGDRDNAMATYNCLVDLNGHEQLGGKNASLLH